MAPQDRAISFPHKHVAKRAAIVAAGPVANFILAIVIFSGLNYVNGRQVLDPRIEAVEPNSPAQAAGFQPNDVILSIDGHAIDSFADMQRVVSARADEPLTFIVRRTVRHVTLQATPMLKEQKTPFGRQRIGLLGLRAPATRPTSSGSPTVPPEPSKRGALETWYVVDRTINYIGKLVLGGNRPTNCPARSGLPRCRGMSRAGGVGRPLGLVGHSVGFHWSD